VVVVVVDTYGTRSRRYARDILALLRLATLISRCYSEHGVFTVYTISAAAVVVFTPLV